MVNSYKIYINSTDRIFGNLNDSLYKLNIPIQDTSRGWGISVECFHVTTSNFFQSKPFYITTSIPLLNTYSSSKGNKTILALLSSQSYYKQINYNTCDCIIDSPINIYCNSTINISITDPIDNNLFVNDWTSWSMCLVLYKI
jgi:hypothetical protein